MDLRKKVLEEKITKMLVALQKLEARNPDGALIEQGWRIVFQLEEKLKSL